jgi:hypothetical protein
LQSNANTNIFIASYASGAMTSVNPGGGAYIDAPLY